VCLMHMLLGLMPTLCKWPRCKGDTTYQGRLCDAPVGFQLGGGGVDRCERQCPCAVIIGGLAPLLSLFTALSVRQFPFAVEMFACDSIKCQQSVFAMPDCVMHSMAAV
jgi:hypothetical protein